MNKFHKFVSVIMHPILLPIAATIIFFMLNSTGIIRETQLKIISLVAIATYIIPIAMLFILKTIGVINNFEVRNISERKIPVIFMIVLFFILGKAFHKIPNLHLLSQLFIGCSIALSIAYFLFIFKLKISLHMIGMSSITAFLIANSIQTNTNITIYIAVLFFIGGIVANARIKLKEHTLNEILVGYTTGFITQSIVLWNYMLYL